MVTISNEMLEPARASGVRVEKWRSPVRVHVELILIVFQLVSLVFSLNQPRRAVGVFKSLLSFFILSACVVLNPRGILVQSCT